MLLVPLQVLYEGTESAAAAAAPAAVNGFAAGIASAVAAAAAVDDAEELDAENRQAMQAARASIYGLEATAGQQHQQQATGSSSNSSSRDVVPTAVLLLRCLEQQLLGVKQTDMGRLAAYTKRLAQLMLAAGPSEALGSACLVYRLMRRYHKLVCQFEWEGGAPVGGRQYDPDCPDPSEAGGWVGGRCQGH